VVTSSLSEHRFTGSELIDDPYPFYAQLRREAPVWQVPDTTAYLVAAWDAIAEATGRTDEFSNHFRHLLYTRDDGTLGVLDQIDTEQLDVFSGADPPVHTLHRKCFAAGLSPKRIDQLQAGVARLVDELLDRLLASRRPDAASNLVDPLPARVIADLIGFSEADPAQLHAWVSAGSRIMGGRIRLEEMADVAAPVGEMPTWIRAQLDAPVAVADRGDVLGITAAGVRDGTLSVDEAVMALMIFVGAGVETTTGLIGNAIRLLAEHGDLQRQLRSQPSLVPPFVEEVLRLESPFQFHPRTATRDTALDGVAIPEGALVLLLWASGNRDERVFDDAGQLSLDRPAAPAHLGFGRGIHHCVGAPLARLEARIALTELLRRTHEFTLVPDDRPIRSDNLWIRRQDRLPLAIDPAGQQ
jgi:cytochrome P450 family 144